MPNSIIPRRRIVAALALCALAACNDTTRAGDSRITFTLNDPVGDTVADQGSGLYPALDAQRLSGYVTADSIIFSIVFTGPVAAPTAEQPNSALALIGIDADADSTTGIPAYTGPFGGGSQVGDEYEITVPDPTGASAEVHDNVLGGDVLYPVTFDGDSMTLRLPISAISTFSTPLRMVAVVGTLERPTDILPNGGYLQIGRLPPHSPPQPNGNLALPLTTPRGDRATWVPAPWTRSRP